VRRKRIDRVNRLRNFPAHMGTLLEAGKVRFPSQTNRGPNGVLLLVGQINLSALPLVIRRRVDCCAVASTHVIAVACAAHRKACRSL